MFGIDTSEYLVVAVVALVLIGPAELPRAMRTVGGWLARARRLQAAVRSGIDEIVRQADASVDGLRDVRPTPAIVATTDTRAREAAASSAFDRAPTAVQAGSTLCPVRPQAVSSDAGVDVPSTMSVGGNGPIVAPVMSCAPDTRWRELASAQARAVVGAADGAAVSEAISPVDGAAAADAPADPGPDRTEGPVADEPAVRQPIAA